MALIEWVLVSAPIRRPWLDLFLPVCSYPRLLLENRVYCSRVFRKLHLEVGHRQDGLQVCVLATIDVLYTSPGFVCVDIRSCKLSVHVGATLCNLRVTFFSTCISNVIQF